MPTRSVLLLATHQWRRLAIAEALHGAGVVVVEAMDVHQAEATLRQLRFDVVASLFVGLSDGIIEFLHGLCADHPETRVHVVHTPVDSHVLADLRAANLTNCRNEA
ncbi:MAG: hypothetical protein ACE5HE_00535 [Phycisphaerae bacterium]